ncbi:Protease prtS [Beauveria bassiana D1-5]|uniref:Protease prtS n=1 Tax=Beauveria bassiana D1-5 TaxID=1245745 RepID=A0A0A2VUH2_BEABA|nr:Protease prtS [Beauveria bassiana D1-5]
MCNQRCYIVPPHLLQAIAGSTSNSEKVRKAAKASLLAREKVSLARTELFATLTQPRGYTSQQRHHVVPPHVFRQISDAEVNDEKTRKRAKDNLEHVEGVIAQYKSSQEKDAQKSIDAQAKSEKETCRAVYDAQHTTNEDSLPGKLIRKEGQKAAKDKAVNEAFDNVGSTLKFYKEHFDWITTDNKNADVISSVHFGEEYENACKLSAHLSMFLLLALSLTSTVWDPTVRQMVFGDGGDFLNNFTASVDVIGHELTHAITEHTSPLDYQGQPGALNEHVSDVFGIMVKQMVEDEKSDAADWLIGEDCLLPGVKGMALRSMKEPGTAYNDPRFGKDLQVSHMKDFKQMYEDNGGVHIFSGIPNKAFYLAATAFGGYSWEKAGQIWWKTMNSGKIPSRCTFLQFADVTVDVAEEEFKAGKIVRKAWDDVGVSRGVLDEPDGEDPDGEDDGDKDDDDCNDDDDDDDGDADNDQGDDDDAEDDADDDDCDGKNGGKSNKSDKGDKDGKNSKGGTDGGSDGNDDDEGDGKGDDKDGKGGKNGKDGKEGKGGKDGKCDGKGDGTGGGKDDGKGDGKNDKTDNDEGDCGCN